MHIRKYFHPSCFKAAIRTLGLACFGALLATACGNYKPRLKPMTAGDCAQLEKENKGKTVWTFAQPYARMLCKGFFFSPEYEDVKKRRELLGVSNAQPTFGLGFSGGGIRANAVQWGILAGLHESKMLPRADYISSVSGGSWASGAYKSSPWTDEKLFQVLEKVLQNPDLKKNNSVPFLMNSYGPELKEFIEFKSSDKHLWEGMIKKFFLAYPPFPGGRKLSVDALIALLDTANPVAARRPYVIWNTTHNYSGPPDPTMKNMNRSFPFEVTKRWLATTADCGNLPYCPRFTSHKNARGAVDTEYPRKVYASRAMAMSSSIGPHLLKLDWPIRFKQIGKNPPYRKKYKLADGGYSENLGGYALLERGIKFIAISDAGADPKYNLEELSTLQFHAKQNFGIELKFSPKDIASMKQPYKQPYLIKGSYVSRHDPNHKGIVFYMKPKYLDDYKKYLAKHYPYVLVYLQKNNAWKKTYGVFPQDATFSISTKGLMDKYPVPRIIAYFLMGKFIAQYHLTPLLKKELEQSSGDK